MRPLIERPGLDHLLDVGAGGENLFPPGEHDRANLVVLIQRFHRRRHVSDQPEAEGIELLRPVQSDNRDGAFFFEQDEFVIHDV